MRDFGERGATRCAKGARNPLQRLRWVHFSVVSLTRLLLRRCRRQRGYFGAKRFRERGGLLWEFFCRHCKSTTVKAVTATVVTGCVRRCYLVDLRLEQLRKYLAKSGQMSSNPFALYRSREGIFNVAVGGSLWCSYEAA